MANVLFVSRVISRNFTSSLCTKTICKSKYITQSSFVFASPRFISNSPIDSKATNAVADATVNGTGSSSSIASNVSTSSSTSSNVVDELDLSQFLAPVQSTETVSQVVSTITQLSPGDLGLTWWLPTGGVFHIVEFLSSHFPMWGAITIFTVCARILVFPLMVRNQSKFFIFVFFLV